MLQKKPFLILKTVFLAQQSSTMNAKDAARELLGSTFLAGCLAIFAWNILDILTTLPMYALLLMLFSMLMLAKLYGILKTNYPSSYWQNTLVTFIILLGSSVEEMVNMVAVSVVDAQEKEKRKKMAAK